MKFSELKKKFLLKFENILIKGVQPASHDAKIYGQQKIYGLETEL